MSGGVIYRNTGYLSMAVPLRRTHQPLDPLIVHWASVGRGPPLLRESFHSASPKDPSGWCCCPPSWDSWGLFLEEGALEWFSVVALVGPQNREEASGREGAGGRGGGGCDLVSIGLCPCWHGRQWTQFRNSVSFQGLLSPS